MADKIFIGITGYKRAGKNTAAAALGMLGFKRLGFADPLKKHLMTLDPFVNHESELRFSQAVELLGWDGAKAAFPEVRRLMQVYGTEVVRDQIDPNYWASQLLRRAVGYSRIVIPDIRYPNEVEATNAFVIRVERSGCAPDGHRSEELPLIPDVVVVNDGTVADLHSKVLDVYHQRYGPAFKR